MLCSIQEQSLQVQTKNNFMMDVPRKNNLNKTRTVNLIKVHIYGPKKPTNDMQSNRPAVPIQNKMSKKHIMPQEDDKNCQVYMKPMKSKLYSDKKCQENIDMQPVKFQMDMQSKKLANLQSTYKKKDQVKSICSDKNCHEIPNVQMRPKKPISHMQSVTKINDMQLPQPAITRLCSDKKCQSTGCYKKKNYDKNSQFYVISESEGIMLFSYVDSNENK